MRQWLKRFLVFSFVLFVFAWIPMMAMGATWVRDVGLLSSDAVVFASDAPAVDRMMATVFRGIYGDRVGICNNDADEVQINAALVATRGKSTCSTGSFTIASPILIPSLKVFSGQGEFLTTINLANGANCNMIEQAVAATSNYFTVEEMNLNGNKTNQAAGGHGIYLGATTDVTVDHVIAHDCKKDGMQATGGSSWVGVVSHSQFNYNGENGFYLNAARGIHMVQDWFLTNTGDGLKVFNGGEIQGSVIGADANTEYGIELSNASKVNLSTFWACGSINQVGLKISTGSHNDFTNGVIRDNNGLGGYQAWLANADLMTLSSCAIAKNDSQVQNGILVSGALLDCSITGNQFYVPGGVFLAAQTSAHTATCCVFSGNTCNSIGLLTNGASMAGWDFAHNPGYIAPGEVRTASGTLLATGSTLTDGTGTFTGSVITLKPGANTVVCAVAGTATIVLPSGCTGSAANGTMTLVTNPTALVGGSNVIETTGVAGNIVVTINHFAAAWHDPELQDILIKKITVEITTPGGTATSVIQCGIADDAIGTNLGSEFFTGLNANAAAVYDSWLAGDTGAQTKYIVLQDSASSTDGWIVFKTNTEISQALVARYFVEYMGRQG